MLKMKTFSLEQTWQMKNPDWQYKLGGCNPVLVSPKNQIY